MKLTDRIKTIREQKGFKGNFLTLFTGTSISQALALLSMPILTRLYDPDSFGRFGIYFALIAVLATLSTGRLELTIQLPKSTDEAKKLWKVSFYVIGGASLLISAVLFVLLQLGSKDFHGIDKTEFWIAVSLGTFFLAFIELLSQWQSRHKNFETIAIRNIIERIAVIVFSISLAFLPWHLEGLIWGQNIAIFTVVLFLILKMTNDRPWAEHLSKKEFVGLLTKYRDFPLMQGWSAILVKLGTQIPILIWGTHFSIEETGQLNLAYRIVEAPVTLLASSFALTYYQHTSQLSLVDLQQVFTRSLRFKAMVLFPIFLVFGLSAPIVFKVIFGDEWSTAGQFAMPLALLSYVKILYLSQSVLLLVLRRLDLELTLSIAFVLSQAIGFYVSTVQGWTAQTTITMMSLFSGFVFLIGLVVVYYQIFSKRNLNQ